MSENTLALVNEIWSMVRESVPANDLPDLAEGMVNVLLDYDFDLDDIRAEFERDGDVLSAVDFIAEYSGEDEAEYVEYGDEDEDEEW